MSLTPFYNSEEEVPEGLKDHYTEVDGKFQIDVTPANGYAFENIEGLRSTLGDWKTKAQTRQGKIEAFGEITAEQAIAAVAAAAKGGASQGEVDNLVKELQTKLQQAESDKENLRTDLFNQKKGAQVSDLLRGFNGQLRDGAERFLPSLVDKYIGANQDGTLFVKNESGQPRLTAKQGDFSSNMTGQEFMDTLLSSATSGNIPAWIDKSDVTGLQMMLKAKDGSGANVDSQGQGATHMTKEAFLGLDLPEQMAAAEANPALNDYFES